MFFQKILLYSIVFPSWHADATFKTCPNLYYQSFTIHGWFEGKMLPCLFVFMRNKEYATYKKALELLREEASKRDLNLRPSFILSDFEINIIKSFKFHFPCAMIKGCYFHYCKCILSKVKKSGLQKEYFKQDELNAWVKK